MENFDGSEDARNRQGALLFGVENGRFIDVSLQKNAYFSYHGTDNCAAKSCLLIPQGRFGVEPVTGVSDGR